MGFFAVSNAFGALVTYLQEDFESGQLSAAWTQEVLSSNTANWVIETTAGAVYPASGNPSNYFVAMRNNTGMDQHYDVRLVSPTMNFTTGYVYQPQLIFNHAQVGVLQDFDTLKVLYRANAGAAWTLLRTFDTRIDTWQYDTIPLIGYIGSTAYQVAFECVENMGRGVVLDDIHVVNTSTCRATSDLQISSIGSSRATLSWSGDLMTDTFEVVVSAAPITDWNNYTAAFHGYATDFSMEVTGLNHSTSYYAYVRARCDENESGWMDWSMNTFQTRFCVNIPYAPTFAKNLLDGWTTMTDMTTAKPTFSSGASYAIDSTYAMVFSGISAGKYALAITPELGLQSPQKAQVSFWGTASTYVQTGVNSNIAKLYVGGLEDPADSTLSTLRIVDSVEIDVYNKHQRFDVSFENYTGNGLHVVFLAKNEDYSTYFYLSNLVISEPEVFTPSVQILNITPDGFDVKANLHGESDWNLRIARASDYKHKAVLPDAFLVSQDGIHGDTYHVSGNFGDSIVAVYAQAVHGSNVSDWSFPVTRRIPARATLPLAYEFQKTAEATQFIRLQDNELRSTSSSKVYPGLYFPLKDYTSFYPKIVTTSPKYDSAHVLLQGIDRWMTLPYIDSFAGQMISFRLAAATDGQSRVAVGVMSDPYDLSTFTQLAVFNGEKNTYALCEVDLDGHDADGHYVAIVSVRPSSPNSTYGSVNHIDALHIEPIPTCRQAYVTYVNDDGTSLSLEWTDRGMTNWVVELFDGNNPDSLLQVKNVQTPSVTFVGLTTLTSYYYRVNTLCGNDTMYGETKQKYTTNCAAISSLPYVETFESYNVGSATAAFFNPCWATLNANAGSTSYPRVYVNNSANFVLNGNRSLYFVSSGSMYEYVILPQFDAPLNTLMITFSHKEESTTSSGLLDVGYMTDKSNEATFVSIAQCTRSTSWQEEEISLAGVPAAVAGDAYIVFRYGGSTSNNYYMGIDDITVEEISTCIRPQNLQVTNITGVSATATWSAGGDETQWQYLCIPANDTVVDWSNAAVVNTPSVALSGLGGSTTYRLYVRAYCSAESQSKAVKADFTTACGSVALPWSEGFEGFEGGSYSSTDPAYEPDCWTLSSISTSIVPHVITEGSYVFVHTGTKALAFYGSGTNTAVMPEFSAQLNTLKIVFWYATESSSLGVLKLGYYNANDTIFHEIETYPCTTLHEYVKAEKMLIGLPATAQHLAFQWTCNSQYDVSIDDITVSQLDMNCTGLSSLRAVAGSPSEASIAWIVGGTQSVDIEVSDSANFAVVEQHQGVTANPFILTGLTANTRYYVRARQSCDTNGEWIESTFKTQCDSMSLEELGLVTFENAEDIDCWSVGVNTPGVRDTDDPSITSASGYGQYLAFVKNATTGDSITRGDDLYAIMPLLSVDSINKYEVLFNAFKTNRDATNLGRLAVGVITDPTDFSTFTAVQTLRLDYASDSLEEKMYAVSFKDYEGDYNDDFGKYIMFLAQSGDSATAIGIDNVEVGLSLSCPQIVEGRISELEIEVDGAIYRWDDNGATAYEVVVMPSIGNPDLSNEVPVFSGTVSADSIVISGLSASTIYYAYVRALCGEEASRWSAHTRFRTACGDIVDFPWNEGFEDMELGESTSDAPLCWTLLNANDGSYPYIYVNNSSSYVKSGNQSLYFRSSTARAGYAILPKFGLPLNTLQIELSHKEENTVSSGALSIGYMTDITDTASFVSLADYTKTTNWQDVELYLTDVPDSVADIAYIALRYGRGGTSNYYMGVDNIVVSKQAACKPLASIVLSDVSRRHFTVQLMPKPGQAPQGYELVCSTSRMSASALDSLTTGKIDVDSTGRYTFSGLDRGTLYYIYARANCGGEDGTSNWISTSVRTKALVGQGEYVIAAGDETDSHVPVYGYYTDSQQHTQSIYPESMLTDLLGLDITQLKYHIVDPSTYTSDTYWRHGAGSFQVSVAITNQTSLASAFATDALTNVYTGSLYAPDTTMTVVFNQPFTYTGGNLLVDFNLPTSLSTYQNASFYGTAQSNASRLEYTYSSLSVNSYDFLPTISIPYQYSVEACPAPVDLSFELVGMGTHEAIIRWDASEDDYLSGCDVVVSENEITDFTGVTANYPNVTGDSVLLTDLTAETTYHVYVRANCTAEGVDEGSSNWAELTFATLANCPAVINLSSELSAANGISVSWATIFADQDLTFMYVYSTDTMSEAALTAAEKHYVNDTLAFNLSELAYDQTYHIYVASVCVADDAQSPWSETTITTEPTCAPAFNLVATRVEHNRVVLTWNRSRFGTTTQWEVGIVGDATNKVVITDTAATVSTMLFGLTPQTAYTAYVRALCSDGEVSPNATVAFTTGAMLNECITIGSGTTTTSYAPVYTYYLYPGYTQQLYTMQDYDAAGMITSIEFEHIGNYSGGDMTAANYTIFMGNTSATSLASGWIGGLTEVFTGTTTFIAGAAGNWVSIELDQPFEWDGESNIVVAIYTPTAPTLTAGSYDSYFYGTSATDMVREVNSGSSSATLSFDSSTQLPTGSGSLYSTLPNIRFCMTASECPAVKSLRVHDLTTGTGIASWEPMGSERSWLVYLADTIISDFSGIVLDTAYTYTYPLTDMLPDKDYWFYVQAACGGEWRAAKFTTVATCSAPIHVTADSISSDFVILSWNDAFEVGQSFVVAYGEAETFDLNDSTTYQIKVVTADSVIIDGLNSVTTYSAAVKANCDAGLVSRYSDIVTFKTECAPKPMPWSDGFEGDVSCWRAGNMQSNVSTYYPSLVTTNVHSGTYALRLYASVSSYTTADSCFAILPEIEYDSVGLQGVELKLSAMAYEGSYSSYYKHLLVGVISDVDMSTFQLVEDLTLTDTYDDYSVAFNTYTGNGNRIVLLAVIDQAAYSSSFYSQVYVDDLTVMRASACVRPATITVLSADLNSASVAWTAGGAEQQWEYVCLPSDAELNWSNATTVNTTSATITGLNSAATYTVYVRSICSDDDMSDARRATFSTACGVVNLPFAENFNTLSSSGDIPSCWSNDEGTTSYSTYKWCYNSGSSNGGCTGTGPDGTNCVRFESYSNSSGNTNYLKTPDIFISSAAQLSFSLKNPAGGDAQVLIAHAGDTTKTVLLNSGLDGLSEWNDFTIDLLAYIGDTVNIYFMGTSNYGYNDANIYLDNVRVSVVNTNCMGLVNFHVESVSLSKADLAWSFVNDTNNVAEIQVASDLHFTQLIDSVVLTDVSSYSIFGLQPSSTYYVRGRQLCGDDDMSDWSRTITLVTSYGVPFAPEFTSSVPDDWMRSNTPASQVFAGQEMNPYTGGWSVVSADNVIASNHFRGNIYGSSWSYWVVTPAIDLEPNVGQGLILSVDAGLVPYSDSGYDEMYTGVDDRFLIAVSIDGGQTWDAADVVEWNNSGSGQFVYNEVPTIGRTYNINMTNYAGHTVKIGFYGESTTANADNNFHFGNISLVAIEPDNLYVDSICEGYGFNEHGFSILYEDLHVGLNATSRYEMKADSTMSLTIQQIWVNPAARNEIPVTLCEGEHYNGYGFDVNVTKSETIRHRIDGGSQFGCDSMVVLQITMLPTVREELHVGCNDDSYTWHGKTYYQSTIVSDTTSSVVTGCDSITTLYLTMCDGKKYNYYGAVCTGSSYSDEFFSGLTTAGEYDVVVTSDIGCVTSAHLTLRQLTSGEAYIDSVLVADLPYVLGNDTLCPETDQAGYVYHGSKDFGCGMVNVTIYVVETKDALGNINASELSIAPNPVRIGEDIRILTAVDMSADYSCRIYDAVGKLVYTSDVPSQTIPGLPVAGAYTVRISSGSALYQGKLIVK